MNIVNNIFEYLDPIAKKTLMYHMTYPMDLFDVQLTMCEYLNLKDKQFIGLNIIGTDNEPFYIPKGVKRFKGVCLTVETCNTLEVIDLKNSVCNELPKTLQQVYLDNVKICESLKLPNLSILSIANMNLNTKLNTNLNTFKANELITIENCIINDIDLYCDNAIILYRLKTKLKSIVCDSLDMYNMQNVIGMSNVHAHKLYTLNCELDQLSIDTTYVELENTTVADYTPTSSIETYIDNNPHNIDIQFNKDTIKTIINNNITIRVNDPSKRPE